MRRAEELEQLLFAPPGGLDAVEVFFPRPFEADEHVLSGTRVGTFEAFKMVLHPVEEGRQGASFVRPVAKTMIKQDLQERVEIVMVFMNQVA